MKLIELYIENFGKLKNYKYSFAPTLNVINEENGYGKSTLAAFIKSMLYGLEDTRKAKLDENDRKKYMPWQGGVFGGTLTFSVGEKTYRIERTFAPKASDDRFTLYDCESGKESKDYTERLGEELFGINVDGFERTVFLSERRLSVKNDNKTISAKLSDLVGCDGDVGELDDAVGLLEERRKYYFKKGGSGRINEIRSAISALDGEINALVRISDALPEKEGRLQAMEAELKGAEKSLTHLRSREQTLSHEKQYLTKKAEKDEAERRLKEVNGFFKRGIPSQGELRDAERRADSYRALKSSLTAAKDTPDGRDMLRHDIDEAQRYIEDLKAKGEKKATKKLYPAALIIAVVFAAAGGAIAAAANIAAGIAMICVGVLALVYAVANFAACKKNVSDDELTAKIRSLLDREDKNNVSESEYLSALISIKAKKDADLEKANSLADKIATDTKTILELERECADFLLGFEIGEGDPYIQIRQHISDSEYLTKRVNDIARDLESIVREYGIDVEEIKEDIDALSGGSGQANQYELEENVRRLRSEITLLKAECKGKRDDVSRLEELYGRKEELEDERKASEERLDVINHTKDHLLKAKDLLTAKYLGKTRAAFAEYMRTIGNEEAELFTMDTSFGITKSEGSASKPTEAYSLGMQDFFALAARLALIETLYDNEKPFVMLDDPFAHFDDKKCATALEALKRVSEKNQIIYLTCSKSRAI